MSPGDATKTYIKAALDKLPAHQRPDDAGRWMRSIVGGVLILVGCVILLIQVVRGETPNTLTALLPAGIPIAAGLFLFDPKHVVDAVRAGRKS